MMYYPYWQVGEEGPADETQEPSIILSDPDGSDVPDENTEAVDPVLEQSEASESAETETHEEESEPISYEEKLDQINGQLNAISLLLAGVLAFQFLRFIFGRTIR